jgi:hypothetical protein
MTSTTSSTRSRCLVANQPATSMGPSNNSLERTQPQRDFMYDVDELRSSAQLAAVRHPYRIQAMGTGWQASAFSELELGGPRFI